MKPAVIAPDIGALVEYGRDGFDKEPGKYRVSAWMRVAPPPPPRDPSDFNSLLDEILFESCQKLAVSGERMQFCLRHEATHVALKGICGRVAPIEQCKVTGHISEHWLKDHVDNERLLAIRLGTTHEMVF